jgi:hypothetical protein
MKVGREGVSVSAFIHKLCDLQDLPPPIPSKQAVYAVLLSGVCSYLQ